MTGLVFDIKEFAVHDGAGIRTTVFLKGCPMRCVWCHNPEGLSPKRELYLKHNGCLHCGLCQKPCTHPECAGLGRCLHICPQNLVGVAGVEWESEALAQKLLAHSDFFNSMGGGITVSGGEPLMQSGFCIELLSALKGRVNTAIETSGYHKVGDGVEIVEEEAKIIREIFETYYAGASLQLICDMLNNREVKAPGKKDKWFPSTIMTILRNEKYKGDVITQKTFCSDLLTHKREKNTGQLPQHYITGHHAAIVEREFFDRVQAEYARRNAKKKVTHNGEEAPQKSKYSSKYALTELLICGDCGCPYRRCTWSKNGQKKIVWRCTTRLEYGKSKCPDSPTMEEEALHRAILKALSSLVENKDEVKDELKVALGNVLIDTGTDLCIAHLEAQLKEQENDMMRVVRICAERGNQKEFEGEFKRINANITELRQIIEVEKTKIRPNLDIESRLDRLFEQITAASADMENFENSIIRQLVAQIRVENAEELTIILHNGFRTTAKI